MPREAPQLDRIECWMHSAVTHPDGAKAGINVHAIQDAEQAFELEQTILPSDELSSLDLISIFDNMCFIRYQATAFEYPKKYLGYTSDDILDNEDLIAENSMPSPVHGNPA